MVYSKLYRLDTSDTEWALAHLFEHLVIKGFYSSCEDKKIQTQLVAWIGGHTFEGIIFIDTLFYTEKLQKEFEDYLNSLPQFTATDIQYSIATLEAEDKVIISVHDKAKLQKEIEKLCARKWNTPIELFRREDIPKPSILTERRSAKDFRDIIIIAKLENLTVDEQKLFLRTHILLRDIIRDLLKHTQGIYYQGSSDVIRRDGIMAFMEGHTVSKSNTVRQLQDTLSGTVIAEVDNLENTLESHFRVFTNEPLWQNAPVDYFRYTDIITTNQEIASLATADRMRSILRKVTFKTRRMTARDRDYLT